MSGGAGVRVLLLLLLGGVLAWPTAVASAAATATPSSASEPDRPSVLTRLTDPRITEGSGLAASGRHDGVLYVVNDSGHGPEVFAVADGRTRATLTLAGAQNEDWESLAAGPGNTLWVGDIGDNDRVRDDVSLYRVQEPRRLRDGTVSATRFRLRYPDGPHDAEALLVHPRTGRVYLATKDFTGGTLYAAPERLSTSTVNTLSRLTRVPSLVTGGEFAPDGERFALRTLASAHVYRSADLAPAEETSSLTLPDQELGESVVWTPDQRALLVGSEGQESAIWRVPVPVPEQAGASRASPTPTPTPTPTEAPNRPWRSVGRYIVAGLLAAAASMLLLRRRGRRRH